MRDPESQTPATSPGLQALSHSHGSLWLEPFPVPEIKESQNPKQSPDTGVSAQKLPRKVGGIGTQNGNCPARPGPPGPGLLAPGLQAGGWSLWLTVPEAVPVPERWAHTNTNTRQALGSLLRISRGSSEG